MKEARSVGRVTAALESLAPFGLSEASSERYIGGSYPAIPVLERLKLEREVDFNGG